MIIWLSNQLKVRRSFPSQTPPDVYPNYLLLPTNPISPFPFSLVFFSIFSHLTTPHQSNLAPGARAYYFRQILHNHNDETCHRILATHLPALSPSFVIIIDDKVFPDAKPATGSVEYTAGLSLAMLTMFSALERREGQWRTLLADAGLEIREIRRFTDFGDSVIVAGIKA